MEATVLQIEERVKKGDLGFTSMGEFGPSRLHDFRYRPNGTVDAATILDRPEITLYCLEDESRQAVFVELPRDYDLYAEPFMYRPQFTQAQRLLTIPYEGLHELAERMGNPFRKLILMNTTGRSGGTLLSRAMNRVPSVLSLDEPDVYHNVLLMRPRDGSRDAELVRLLQSSTRLLFKPNRGGMDTLFIKYRNCCIEIGDLMDKAYPEAKVLFLYRNGEAWVRSVARSVESVLLSGDSTQETSPFTEFFCHLDDSEPWSAEPATLGDTKARGGKPRSDANPGSMYRLITPYVARVVKSRMTPRDKLAVLWLLLAQRIPGLRGRFCAPLEYLQPYIQSISPMKLLTVVWLSVINRYLELHAQGIPMLAVQYEMLVAEPEPALRGIFEYCGLPAALVSAAEGAFAEDSQKDTPIARDRVRAQKRNLAPKYLEEIREVLREHPPITADFVVPGSLDLARAKQTVV
ncbi:MAG: hypothetical protein JO323_21370 [Acidobacteriia bacterium]|nr:hypothetical protein [Terriglobia bacterium]